MGCFDYECACGGKSCDHVGGQLWESKVIIEVPLSDGKKIYLHGEYEMYGYVLVEDKYKFYLKEFDDYFQGWFDGESENELSISFLANKAWTVSEHVHTEDKFGDEISGHVHRHCFDDVDAEVSDLTPNLLAKCIRADNGLNIVSKAERLRQRNEELRAQIANLQKQLAQLEPSQG